jgi:uncharacterized protein
MVMDGQESFPEGASILYRVVDEHGKINDVKPVKVIEDSRARTVLWLPQGTPTLKPELLHPTRSGPRRWDKGWRLVESFWRRSEALIIIQGSQSRAVWLKWSKDRNFLGWDINLQSPLCRTHLGFDIEDHQLDIVVEPNRQWRWKDEDELALAIERGRLTVEQAQEVRREGEAAVTDIEAFRSPFCDGWERWRPGPELQMPILSPAWNDVSMYDTTD